jgi:hypothetical protein
MMPASAPVGMMSGAPAPATAMDDEAVARADKEMEERANRAKELLSQRYRGLKTQQVRVLRSSWVLILGDLHSRIDPSSSCWLLGENDHSLNPPSPSLLR